MFMTGVGRGIGKGMAQVLAVPGADIVRNALTSREAVSDRIGLELHDRACAVPGWRVEPVNPLQLLIFERHEITSGSLPGPIRLLLHGVEGHDGDPVRPNE